MKCTTATHEALKQTAQWLTLERIGVQRIDADAFGPAEAIELRNCTCGSTLAKEIK